MQMNNMKTLKDIGDKSSTVLLRVDLNVPMEGDVVGDDTRIKSIIPTIEKLQTLPRKIILCSHFGRPKNGNEEKYSLKQIIYKLEEILQQKVIFIETLEDLGEKDGLYLFENTRFNAGEEENSDIFAQYLAKHADIYVNDAFSASHRAHASTVAVTKYLPSYAGLALEKELKALQTSLEKPKRPLTAIVGGAKISTKIDLLYNLIKKTDYLIIGGGMANSFLAANSIDVGASLFEHNILAKAVDILQKAKENNCAVILPIDVVVSKKFSDSAETSIRLVGENKPDEMILDVGPQTIKLYNKIIAKSKTVIWNGPMGAFELKPFSKGTIEVAKFIAQQTELRNIVSVAGGGDTVYALKLANVYNKLNYVSTAGGAFLEWMEGKTLPAIEALQTNKINN